MNFRRLFGIFPILAISAIPTLLVWLPFYLRLKQLWGIPLPGMGMATIVANYDGPLFMVVSKTFYNPDAIKSFFEFPLPVEYYAAHFPLFPSLIRISSLALGYPYAMLFVTLVSGFLALLFFQKLAEDYVGRENSFWLTLFFAFIPARFLIVRSVGSAEPLFMAMILASVYFFKHSRFLYAGIFGALAQLTKSPGILLFFGYILSIVAPQLKTLSVTPLSKWVDTLNLKRLVPIFLIPLSLLAVFVLYKIRLNDFLAYFHSGDNIHLIFPPFSIFNYSAPWVGTFWLEEVLLVYLLGLLGLSKLIKNKDSVLYWITGIFLFSIFFVAHRDIMRYALPIVPFIIIAFSQTLIKREVRPIILLLMIPTYLFAISFVSQNAMPISDWAPFL